MLSKEKSSLTKSLIGLAMFIIIVVALLNINSFIKVPEPIDASGLTVEERREIDESFLTKTLKEDYKVKDMEIDYGKHRIIIYLDALETDQYIEETAKDLNDDTLDALKKETASLTIENPDKYYVQIVDNNDKTIN